MAKGRADEVGEKIKGVNLIHDLRSLLSSSDRDFLIRNNGDRVQIESLKGKKVGLYFSASRCSPRPSFTPKLVEVYDELSSKGDFEIVFASADEPDDESFRDCFSKIPWLAIPFSDSITSSKLIALFDARGIPFLVILDENGKVLTTDGVEIILEYGVDAYPFTNEKIRELEEQEGRARRRQSLSSLKRSKFTQDICSLLYSSDRDFLIRNNGDQVQIESLKGKKVGLYFSGSWCAPCRRFTPRLVEVYSALSSKGKFEIVFASLDGNDRPFRDYFSKMPWLAIPFSDSETSDKLIKLFDVRSIPFLAILDENGKVLTTDAVEIIQEYGVDGYPFANEKIKGIDLTHDICFLLSSSNRDFLVCNNGDRVDFERLIGKKVGLYFSGSWCGPCQRFTQNLVEVYNKLSSKGDFEIVFSSADEQDEEAFKDYFSKMPWLSIRFSDSKTRGKLDILFEAMAIPFLVILDENGKVLTTDGVEIIREYGVDAYPFTNEKIRELQEHEERARREPSLKSILVSCSRDFVVSADGKKVSVSELVGKIIGLYFSKSSCNSSSRFTPKLIEVYNKLKEKGENFEVVMIPLDEEEEEESFNQDFGKMPWFSLPFKDELCGKLAQQYQLSGLPTLVVIGTDGETLRLDVAETIEDYGDMAYPFTPGKFAELEQIYWAKQNAQTLESILVSGELDFVIGKDGIKVPISDLVGKHILLYFSAHWCPPCREFMPKLAEAYHQIKEKDKAFEAIFISSDNNQAEFEEFFAKMPWLALPFGDNRKKELDHIFKIECIPSVVALDPTGKTITTDAHHLIMALGSEVYPFTEDRLKEIKAKYDEMAKGWPEKVKHELHDHELALSRSEAYICDGCNFYGKIWTFNCVACNFDLHPECATGDIKNKFDGEQSLDGEKAKDGWSLYSDGCCKPFKDYF